MSFLRAFARLGERQLRLTLILALHLFVVPDLTTRSHP
jgi:hypothetical protein